MPRRREVAKRLVMPDPKYKSVLVAKFVNNLMRCGKKSVAESIFYGALSVVSQRAKGAPLAVFERALENVKPAVEVKSRRVGGATYQVPVEVSSARRLALGMRWLISHARERAEKTMEERLAMELIDASNSRGSAMRKRETVHKMAEANKAFAHYRF